MDEDVPQTELDGDEISTHHDHTEQRAQEVDVHLPRGTALDGYSESPQDAQLKLTKVLEQQQVAQILRAEQQLKDYKVFRAHHDKLFEEKELQALRRKEIRRPLDEALVQVDILKERLRRRDETIRHLRRTITVDLLKVQAQSTEENRATANELKQVEEYKESILQDEVLTLRRQSMQTNAELAQTKLLVHKQKQKHIDLNRQMDMQEFAHKEQLQAAESNKDIYAGMVEHREHTIERLMEEKDEFEAAAEEAEEKRITAEQKFKAMKELNAQLESNNALLTQERTTYKTQFEECSRELLDAQDERTAVTMRYTDLRRRYELLVQELDQMVEAGYFIPENEPSVAEENLMSRNNNTGRTGKQHGTGNNKKIATRRAGRDTTAGVDGSVTLGADSIASSSIVSKESGKMTVGTKKASLEQRQSSIEAEEDQLDVEDLMNDPELDMTGDESRKGKPPTENSRLECTVPNLRATNSSQQAAVDSAEAGTGIVKSGSFDDAVSQQPSQSQQQQEIQLPRRIPRFSIAAIKEDNNVERAIRANYYAHRGIDAQPEVVGLQQKLKQIHELRRVERNDFETKRRALEMGQNILNSEISRLTKKLTESRMQNLQLRDEINQLENDLEEARAQAAIAVTNSSIQNAPASFTKSRSASLTAGPASSSGPRLSISQRLSMIDHSRSEHESNDQHESSEQHLLEEAAAAAVAAVEAAKANDISADAEESLVTAELMSSNATVAVEEEEEQHVDILAYMKDWENVQVNSKFAQTAIMECASIASQYRDLATTDGTSNDCLSQPVEKFVQTNTSDAVYPIELHLESIFQEMVRQCRQVAPHLNLDAMKVDRYYSEGTKERQHKLITPAVIEGVDDMERKIRNVLQLISSINNVRNSEIRRINHSGTWCAANTRMFIRCLDLILQTIHNLLSLSSADGSEYPELARAVVEEDEEYYFEVEEEDDGAATFTDSPPSSASKIRQKRKQMSLRFPNRQKYLQQYIISRDVPHEDGGRGESTFPLTETLLVGDTNARNGAQKGFLNKHITAAEHRYMNRSSPKKSKSIPRNVDQVLDARSHQNHQQFENEERHLPDAAPTVLDQETIRQRELTDMTFDEDGVLADNESIREALRDGKPKLSVSFTIASESSDSDFNSIESKQKGRKQRGARLKAMYGMRSALPSGDYIDFARIPFDRNSSENSPFAHRRHQLHQQQQRVIAKPNSSYSTMRGNGEQSGSDSSADDRNGQRASSSGGVLASSARAGMSLHAYFNSLAATSNTITNQEAVFDAHHNEALTESQQERSGDDNNPVKQVSTDKRHIIKGLCLPRSRGDQTNKDDLQITGRQSPPSSAESCLRSSVVGLLGGAAAYTGPTNGHDCTEDQDMASSLSATLHPTCRHPVLESSTGVGIAPVAPSSVRPVYAASPSQANRHLKLKYKGRHKEHTHVARGGEKQRAAPIDWSNSRYPQPELLSLPYCDDSAYGNLPVALLLDRTARPQQASIATGIDNYTANLHSAALGSVVLGQRNENISRGATPRAGCRGVVTPTAPDSKLPAIYVLDPGLNDDNVIEISDEKE